MKNARTMLAVVGVVAGGLVVAGPLSPPAGPVVSSYKTLSEVEARTAVNDANTPGDNLSVYRITQPGSYYLTGNIAGQANKTGVMIDCANVSLDLNGFTISGGYNGVSCTAGATKGVSVRNGAVTGSYLTGINLYPVVGGRVEDVCISNCITEGMSIGAHGVAARVSAVQCAVGIRAREHSRVEDCSAAACTQEGFYGSEEGVVFVRCTSAECNHEGFNLPYGKRCLLESCVARGNGYSGIKVGAGARVTGCTVSGNQGNGLELGEGCVAERCIAAENVHIGIVADAYAEVRCCEATRNQAQGIKTIGAMCAVIENQVSANGSGLAGIWINSSGCRVEGNRAFAGGFGVYVDGADNFVARNTSVGATNTPYWIAAGNEAAQVVLNPGASGFIGSGPWSNFAY